MNYPKSIVYIVASTFCERFSFFGVNVFLPLYFIDILKYDENTATVLYHALQMIANFFPLITVMIADSWLGKHRTILCVTGIYALGKILIFVATMPTINLSIGEVSLVSLLLIAIGAGGIKPCFSAFGVDQFKLPEQATNLAAFFSIFYVAENSAAIFSTVLTPILRKDVSCYGQNTCYPLAFLISAVFVVGALGIFFVGKKYYTIKDPKDNITWKVVTCMSYAVCQKLQSNDKQPHWLDYASNKYDTNLILDIKSALKVLKLFIPIPIFWALYDLQSTRWLFQAMRTNGEVLSYLVKPDQFLVVRAISVFLLIPIFRHTVYPVIETVLLVNTPLRKMTVGGLLTALAFAVSGVFEMVLEPTYVAKPTYGIAQVRIFNAIDCNASIYIDKHQHLLDALNVYQDLNAVTNAGSKIDFSAEFVNCTRSKTPNYTFKDTLRAKGAKATSWFLTSRGISPAVTDSIAKSISGDPKLRVLISLDSNVSSHLFLKLQSRRNSYNINITSKTEFTDFIEVNHNTYKLIFDGKVIGMNVNLRFGGVYTIIGYISNTHKNIQLTTQVQPNSIHMFWLIPQYVILKMGEVMLAVTGIEFAYSQAPQRMRMIVQAAWHLTASIGNLIVVIVVKAQIFHRQAYEFFLLAGLMLIAMVIFAVMAKFYKYVEVVPSVDGKCETVEEEKQCEE